MTETFEMSHLTFIDISTNNSIVSFIGNHLVVTCPAFPPLENGWIRYSGGSVNGGYGINYLVNFYCNYPYVRSGPEEDRCQSSGRWVNQDETRTCRQGSAPSDPSKGHTSAPLHQRPQSAVGN